MSMPRKKEQPKANTKAETAVKQIRQPKKTPRKKVFFFTFEDNEYSLTALQKAFCDFYLTKGVKPADAVLKAGYDISGYKDKDLASRKIASENNTKSNIQAYLRKEIGRLGLNAEHVTKVHAELLDDENGAIRSKGIDMYYKIHGTYVADSSEASVNAELAQALKRIRDVIPD